MPVLYQIGSIFWFVHKYKGYLIMAICSLYIAPYYNIVLCQWLYDKTFFHHYRGFTLVGTHDSCQTTICISYFFFVSFNFYVDFFFPFLLQASGKDGAASDSTASMATSGHAASGMKGEIDQESVGEYGAQNPSTVHYNYYYPGKILKLFFACRSWSKLAVSKLVELSRCNCSN